MDRKLSKSGIIRLINLYRSKPILWDKNIKTFRCQSLKEDAYQEIGAKMGMAPETVKKKLHSLRTTYTAERKRVLSKNSTSDTEERCIPTLSWFSEMVFLDKFIASKIAVEDSNSVCSKNYIDAKSHAGTVDEMTISPEIKKEELEFVKPTCADEKSDLLAKKSIPPVEENYTIDTSLSVDNSIIIGNTIENSDEDEMNSQDSYENKCRICLDEDVQLDWNEILYSHGRLTYKDCYYKYTQLEYFDEDNFSTMLCRNCANGLEYIDTFISKAIEAHVEMQERRHYNAIVKADEDNLINELPNFETMLVEEPEIKTERKEDPEEEFLQISTEGETCSTPERCFTPLPEIEEQPKHKKLKRENEICAEWFVDEKKECRKIEQRVCCTICSKVLASKYKAIKHEKTHIENRERNETCGHCGLKFFSKEVLRSHMVTHLENRRKTHKCEFCDKSFYNKSGLNIHLRIHLGQMIPCLMCTKQFFRQIDLDKHMASHSASRINSDIKVREKKFVRCKDCGENVRTTSFKSHTARHMNEPLFKCSLCNKEFYFRDSCKKHLTKSHDLASGETKQFIIVYKKNRVSHLFMQQYSNEQISS